MRPLSITLVHRIPTSLSFPADSTFIPLVLKISILPSWKNLSFLFNGGRIIFS